MPTITLNSEQQRGVDLVESGKNVFVTGPGGTGKSFLARYLRAHHNCIVVSSTAVSAANVEGVTFHSFFGIGLGQDPPEVCAHRMHKDRKAILSRVPRVLIDECSMLSPEVLELASNVCKIIRKSDAPFGGIQIVIMGDFFQLPPVSRNKVVYAFEGSLWEQLELETVKLTTILRQDDEVFQGILNAIRVGDMDFDFDPLYDRMMPLESREGECSMLFTHNKSAIAANTRRFHELKGEAVQFRAVDSGHDRLVKDSRLPELLPLKVGTKVLHLANMGQLKNGTFGEVIDFSEPNDDDQVFPICEFTLGNGTTIKKTVGKYQRNVYRGFESATVKPTEDGDYVDDRGDRYPPSVVDDSERVRRPRIIASRANLPLTHGWAMSIHKSQGMGISQVHVQVAKSFAPGQVYTGLSRAETLAGLSLDTFNAIQVSTAVRKFYEALT